ncbi:uclacyanin-3 [Cinnamomum micranthum f. kanehirae]|uniref:Uclacyanin-3 n=1 Tax=Cinnamomum micranthum f. kanehirae TaxID=337451 RepID=A0A443P7P9_9MAGN|nr:uclacyanin-3 [Cinnamomum micranthum f. kanehirae]
MAVAVGLLLLLLAVPAAYATNYKVGDTAGWDTNVDYTTWVSGKTFLVGDTLLFTYGSSHRVDVVNKAGYDGCSGSNALQTYSDGNTTIALSSTGSYYYLCPILNHCSQGMKLAVTVTAGNSSTPGGTPPTTGTPTTNTSSPSAPTPSRNGAMGRFCWMDALVVGACLMLVPLLGL